MAEEKKEPWLNYLALTTVILAVCATLSIFKGCGVFDALRPESIPRGEPVGVRKHRV